MYLLKNEGDPFPEYIKLKKKKKHNKVLKLYILCYLLCITRAENENIYSICLYLHKETLEG